MQRGKREQPHNFPSEIYSRPPFYCRAERSERHYMIRRADNPWPGSVVEPLSLHYTGGSPNDTPRRFCPIPAHTCAMSSGAPAGMLPPATAKMTPRF